MTGRDALTSFAATGLAAAASTKVLENMGSAGLSLTARIKAMGKNCDMIEYCHSMGLGAAHTNLPADLDPTGIRKIRDQVVQPAASALKVAAPVVRQLEVETVLCLASHESHEATPEWSRGLLDERQQAERLVAPAPS